MYGASNLVPIHLLVRFSRYSLKKDRLGAVCARYFFYTLWEKWRPKQVGGLWNFYRRFSHYSLVHVGAVGICLAATLVQQARCFSLTWMFS